MKQQKLNQTDVKPTQTSMRYFFDWPIGAFNSTLVTLSHTPKIVGSIPTLDKHSCDEQVFNTSVFAQCLGVIIM